MSDAETPDSTRRKFPVHRRLYLIGACILIAGLIGAALICVTGSNEGDGANAYENVDASVYAVMPTESRRYQYDLERVGGKSAVLAAELDDWFTSLWHGKRLGYTLAVLSIAAALVFFMFAYLLSFQPHDETGDRNG